MSTQLEEVTTRQGNKWKINMLVDVIFLIAFLIVIEEKGIGPVIHEWLGIAIVGVILIHVLIHWDWVVCVTKRFFSKLKAEPRINYLVDLGILISFTTIIFSGLMMSESVLPAFGVYAARSNLWKFLHVQSTDLTVILTGLHVALHYKWVVNVFKRIVGLPASGVSKEKAQGSTASKSVVVE